MTNIREIENQIAFHRYIEDNVQDLQHGQITVNCVIKNGNVALNTTNLVKSRRIKYKAPNI